MRRQRTVPKTRELLRHAATWAMVAAFVASLVSVAHAQQKGWPRAGVNAGSRIQASPLVADLDGNGRKEILIPSLDDKLYIYNHDGTTFALGSAWPKTLGFSDGTMASVAVGDIDGVAGPEIVVVGDDAQSVNCTVKVYKPDGSGLGTLNVQSILVNATASGKATPCLVDVLRYDGVARHAAQEIVLRDGDGRVHVLYWNGTGFSNKYDSALFNTCTADSQRDRFGSLAITPSVCAAYDASADVTYLIAGSTDGNVYRWSIRSTTGLVSANWQVSPMSTLATDATTGTKIFGSPALGDLDTDPALEIIAATSTGEVYVWDNNAAGTPDLRWPIATQQTIYSSPAVADIDLDGTNEVIIGSNDSNIYVWNPDGTMKDGWPQATGGDIFASPVIGEIDGLTGLEIVTSSMDGRLYAWTYDGTALPGWPKRMKALLFSTPALADIHNGERMAVLVGGYDGKLYCFDLAPKSLDVDMGWLQFRGGASRQGHR